MYDLEVHLTKFKIQSCVRLALAPAPTGYLPYPGYFNPDKTESLFNGYIIPSYNTTMSVLGHPGPWQMSFQLPATPIAEGIIAFHDDLMVFLTFILFFVIIVLGRCLYTFTDTKKKESRII